MLVRYVEVSADFGLGQDDLVQDARMEIDAYMEDRLEQNDVEASLNYDDEEISADGAEIQSDMDIEDKLDAGEVERVHNLFQEINNAGFKCC